MFATFALISSSCTTVNVAGKASPEYVGVDPRAEAILKKYLSLSIENNIHFSNKVTIGFKHINRGSVVGQCSWNPSFREIDIDINYWNYSTYTSKMSLLFHELSHCYCKRRHDHGNNPGHFEDGCPTSLMCPTTIEDDCMRAHYDEYSKELFDRCQPW